MPTSSEQKLARNLYRNLKVLAFLTIVLLAVLASVPLRGRRTEWRSIQQAYNIAATRAGLPEMDVAIQQTWLPELEVVDRCTSCHVGSGAARPIPNGGPLFGPHPEIHHDAAELGCTPCHEGQGLATSAAAAHGNVIHWEEPMIEKPHLEASCGRCHGAAVHVPALRVAERGAYLFDLHGCKSCHSVDGQGGTVAPDLSGVALKGFDRAWHIRHLKDPGAVVAGSKMMNFGHLRNADIDAILAYLDTLVGAPKLVRGKVLSMELGCRGCHVAGGTGGDVAPDLSVFAAKRAVDLDFSNVAGPKTVANWIRHQLSDPRALRADARMPAFHLEGAQADALITYLLSLKKAGVPMEKLPKGTVAVRLHGARDFSGDGANLYRIFCSACHGPEGEGSQLITYDVRAPAVINADFLSVASEGFLRAAITRGRTGRTMSGWGSRAGGLTRGEIDALVGFLRGSRPTPPDFEQVRVERGDVRLGSKVFGAHCSGCHGLDGEGTEIAPSVVNPELLYVANDRFLYDTIVRGRRDTAMPAHRAFNAHELASLVTWIRGHEAPPSAASSAPPEQPAGRMLLAGLEAVGAAPSPRPPRAPGVRDRMERRLRWAFGPTRLSEYRAAGSVTYGKVVFKGMCAGCHGARGEGRVAPAIANPDFLAAVNDGFIAGTIVLGRSGRAMRAFGPHGLAPLRLREIGDVITYIRHLSSRWPKRPLGRKVQGDAAGGSTLFARMCAGCHGESGRGGVGPALNNPDFLGAATDGYLQATIAKGRKGTAMRAWARGGFGFAEISPADINDIVAYIRTWQSGSGVGLSR